MSLLAIDPGASGGIAWRTADGVFCKPMPHTPGDILDLLREITVSGQWEARIEDIPRFTGQSIPSSTAAVLFENYGFIQGVLAARGIRTIRIRPQEWQKGLGLGTRKSCASGSEWKNRLKAEAQRRFPGLDVTLKTADALLILDYRRGVESEGAE